MKTKTLISKEELQKRVKELAKEISEDYKEKDPLFISILNGSFIFCSDLIKNIPYPIEVHFMRASSYLNETVSSGTVTLSDVSFDIKDRNVVIIEDILDTGRTLNKVKESLTDKGAKSIKSVVLLNKPARRVVDFDPDYVGFEIEDNFVVGYGNDYKQKGRNLPYIGIIEE